MAKGNNISELAKAIKEAGKRHLTIQTQWAKVKAVDWEAKTMTATGVADDLDYLDVNLGLGVVHIKPKKDSLCLLGKIENQDAATYLIDVKEVEEVSVELEGGIRIRMNSEGYKIEKGSMSLRKVFDRLHTLIEGLKVNTPSGPSAGLLPDTVLALNQFKTAFEDILK